MLTSDWNKSSISSNDGSCVEVRLNVDNVEVRDSKNPNGPVLSFTKNEWLAFELGSKNGEFDI